MVDNLWLCFICYLTNQLQQLKCVLPCTVLPVISGVPQGSILGLLIFLVCMNSISSGVQASQVLKFADVMSTSSPDDRVKLQQDY